MAQYSNTLSSSQKAPRNVLTRSLALGGTSGSMSRKTSGQDIGSAIIPALAKSSNELESEYIRNLQRQIFYLEMETKHLREQVKRASDLQPVMASEAAKMLDQLRTLTLERDALKLELSRRDVNNEMLRSEKGVAIATLSETQNRLEVDKRALLDQVLEYQNKNNSQKIDIETMDRQLAVLNVELETAKQKITDLENRLHLAVKQHDGTNDRLRQTQMELERKLVDLAQKDSQIRSLDAQLYDATVVSKDKSTELLNHEILKLKSQLREAEEKLEKEKIFNMNSTARAIEDAYNLRSTVLSPRFSNSNLNLTGSSLFANTSVDRQKLQTEADLSRSAFLTEKAYGDQMTNQLRVAEDRASRAEINNQAMKNRVHEMEMQQTLSDNETSQLRNEKSILITHMQEMQKESTDRDRELNTLRKKMADLQRSIEAD